MSTEWKYGCDEIPNLNDGNNSYQNNKKYRGCQPKKEKNKARVSILN